MRTYLSAVTFFVNKNFNNEPIEKISNFAEIIFKGERTDKTILSQQLKCQETH